ncbi:MAG: DUF4091 domain-containing protein [Nitrospirota bacterium]|nr:DUF4091 domain-containing protein [Nitrospirota bacterium]
MGIVKNRVVMAMVKKWFLGVAILSGILGGIFLLGLFMLTSDSFREFAKDRILPIVKDYHPFGHIRTALVSVKNSLHRNSIGTKKEEVVRPLGFVGNRAEKDGYITTWISLFSDRISPDVAPSGSRVHPKGQSRPLTLVGLRGETLSFQLVLRSPSDIDHLNVVLVPSGNSPGTDCLRIHRFLEYYLKLMVHTGSKYGPLKEVINPDPLIPFNDPYLPGHQIVSNLSLKSGINQPVWIDVRYRKSCSPGEYSGNLIVSRSGEVVRKTPVKFVVLSATLPDRVHLDRWMEIYMTRFWQGELIPNDQMFRTLLYRYFRMAHKYGFATNPSGDIGPAIQWDWNTGKPTSVNWDRYDQIYGPLLSGELTGKSPNVLALPIGIDSLGVGMWGGFMIEGGSPTPIEEWKGIPDIATQQLAKLLVQHWKEKGWPIERTFAYPFDEPMHKLFYYPDIYKLIRKVGDSLHEGSKNRVRLMLTDVPWSWDKRQKGHDKSVMEDAVDIWAPGAVLYIPERMQKLQAKRKKAWFYQNGPPFIGGSDLASTGLGFRMWFWTAWKYRVNGVFYWVSNFWPGNNASINPYKRQGSGDGVIFYPGRELHFIGYPDVDGPIPSIRMAQWRRGYEDYKYLYMLKHKGQGSDADRSVNTLVHKALDDGGYIPYWRNPLWWKPGDWSHDPREWHRERVRLAKEISLLYANK